MMGGVVVRVTLRGRQMAEAQTETEWLGKGEGSDPRPSLGFELNRSLPCLDLAIRVPAATQSTASLRQTGRQLGKAKRAEAEPKELSLQPME